MVKEARYVKQSFWILFGLSIFGIIVNLMTNENIVALYPGLYWIGEILSILCTIIYACVLLKMASENDHYRLAGVWSIVAIVISTVVTFLSSGEEAETGLLLLSIPAAMVALYGEYHEYAGHSDILEDYDSDLSYKWHNLFKWYIGSIIGLFVCIPIVVFIPILGMLGMIVTAIILFVVSILKLVYLYKTTRVFQEHSVE